MPYVQSGAKKKKHVGWVQIAQPQMCIDHCLLWWSLDFWWINNSTNSFYQSKSTIMLQKLGSISATNAQAKLPNDAGFFALLNWAVSSPWRPATQTKPFGPFGLKWRKLLSILKRILRQLMYKTTCTCLSLPFPKLVYETCKHPASTRPDFGNLFWLEIVNSPTRSSLWLESGPVILWSGSFFAGCCWHKSMSGVFGHRASHADQTPQMMINDGC